MTNTQRMLCANQQQMAQSMPVLTEAPPVLVDWLPWNHTFGSNHNVGMVLFHGGTLYIDDGKPTPALMRETLRNLRDIAPTLYFNVAWPFAQVAQSAALTKPDLVIHIGDMHYRESPCPAGNAGCAGSGWGYGFDAWQADFFVPAKPLLAAAPWVFVRGNHEICSRAGQGWFRFTDAQPWQAARSCNDPANDHNADFSNPYAVQITPDTQFIVFDSAKASGKPYKEDDPAFAKYKANLQASDALSTQKPHNFFMSHHPLLDVTSGKKDQDPMPGATHGLQSVFKTLHQQRLFAPQIDVAMHGHIDVFEALAFESGHPTSLVLGNAGSANDGNLPTTLPPDFEVYPGAVVDNHVATTDYGFATLDCQTTGPAQWLMTAFSVQGAPMFKCAITGSKSKCVKVGATN